jgi:hypothetical protein
MKKIFFVFIVSTMFIAQLSAQTVAIAVTEAEMLSGTGGTDSGNGSGVVTQDGSFFYFHEGSSSAGSQFGLYRIDLSGPTTTAFITAADTETAAGGGGGQADLDDMTVDSSGNIYLLYRESGSNDNYILRTSPGGVVSRLAGPSAVDGAVAIDYDGANDRLVVAIEESFTSLPTSGGLYVIANPGTGTDQLAPQLASDLVIAGGLSPAGVDTSDVGIGDIVVLSTGDIIVSNIGTSSGGNAADGDIISVASDGSSATALIDGLAYVQVVNALETSQSLFRVYLESNSSDQILIYIDGGPASVENSLSRYDSNGTNGTLINDETDVLAVTSDTDVDVDDRGISITNNGVLYVSNFEAGSESILSFSGALVPVELSAFDVE